MKINYQNPFFFVAIAIFLMIVWGLAGYHILGPLYFLMSFLVYLAIFLLGMLFKIRNWVFIPVTYVSVYGSDFVSRMILDDFQTDLFTFLVLYHIKLIILSITKINLDAKNQALDVEKKRKSKWIAVIMPIGALLIYYFIIKQVFVLVSKKSDYNLLNNRFLEKENSKWVTI